MYIGENSCLRLQLTNFRRYGPQNMGPLWKLAGLQDAVHVWFSNHSLSEQPYSVTGTVKHEGLKKAPKYKMLRKKYRNVGSCGYVA